MDSIWFWIIMAAVIGIYIIRDFFPGVFMGLLGLVALCGGAFGALTDSEYLLPGIFGIVSGLFLLGLSVLSFGKQEDDD